MEKLNTAESRILRFINERPVAYRPEIAKCLGDVNATIILSQFLYWSNTPLVKKRGGWFYKTHDELYEETGITRKAQYTARKKLKEVGILEIDRKGVPAKNWYRVNLKTLAQYLDENVQMFHMEHQDVTNRDNKMSSTEHHLLQENTPESTALSEESCSSLLEEEEDDMEYVPEDDISYESDDDTERDSFGRTRSQAKKAKERRQAVKTKPERIVAEYFRRKGYTFENKFQEKEHLGRARKVANRSLKFYEWDTIEEAFDFVEEQYSDMWTIETVEKKIPDVKLQNEDNGETVL